jgi:hypothetical protein
MLIKSLSLRSQEPFRANEWSTCTQRNVLAVAPEERQLLVFRNLCAVGEACQITDFAVDHSAAEAVATKERQR